MSYWDTSALVKLYAPEADSDIFELHASRSIRPIVTSRLTLYEVLSSFRRKESENQLAQGAARALIKDVQMDVTTERVRLIEVSDDVERAFAEILETCHSAKPAILLRTADAIHLASARVAKESEIVATDKRMRDAAKATGFTVFPE